MHEIFYLKFTMPKGKPDNGTHSCKMNQTIFFIRDSFLSHKLIANLGIITFLQKGSSMGFICLFCYNRKRSFHFKN